MFKKEKFPPLKSILLVDRLSNRQARVLYLTALIIFSTLYLTACTNQQQVSISLGTPRSTLTSLVWLTEELGYFKAQGIHLQLHPYPSGKRALAGMLKGEVELAGSAETPFVIASFKHDDLRLFATMGQSDNELRVLARRDRGINEPSDLQGKIVATQKDSAVHFFLNSFLLYHRLEATAVRMRFMKAEDLPGALAQGNIDAFSMREPFLFQSKNIIGADKLVEFSVPGLYTKSYNIVGSKNFVRKHPGAMQKILYALNQGAEYVEQHPEKAIAIISRKLQLPEQTVKSLFPDMRLSITLNQALIVALNEQAHWFVASGSFSESGQLNKQIPDFLSRIDPIPLEKAVPYAVNLFGAQSQ